PKWHTYKSSTNVFVHLLLTPEYQKVHWVNQSSNMRPTTFFLAALTAISTTVATVDISNLCQELQNCMTGNHHVGFPYLDPFHWEDCSYKDFCKSHGKMRSWWKNSVFPCVCRNNRFSEVDNVVIGRTGWMRRATIMTSEVRVRVQGCVETYSTVE
ncbi:hypothetical protein D6D23_03431, partial [Aureobasidium pullulans]